MARININSTKKKEIVNLTNKIADEIAIKNGVVNLFVLHTTCALTIAELDPGTDLDFLDAIEAIAPDLDYRHPHDPSHAPDHIMSSMIGMSLTVPVENGALVLGTWQSIVLIELNGPRNRKVVFTEIPL